MNDKLSAPLIYTNVGEPLQDAVIVLDDQGTILRIDQPADHDPSSIRRLEGCLIPGYINAHCHLELSHMKGKVDTGTGLVTFIRQVVSRRGEGADQIDQAIYDADREMWHNGIRAVGDICNVTDTFTCKQESDIRYYSFVEMFDFMQEELAASTFAQYQKVYQKAPQGDGNQRTAVPHAPYSVSPELFAMINRLNADAGTVSIHNQETPSEDAFFVDGGGDFPDLFGGFGYDMSGKGNRGTTAIYYALEHLDPKHRTLFVHNTLTDAEDIAAAHRWSDQVFWVSCPNANLYIENRLPDYSHFVGADARVCLGTDSLTSNWQLSIFEEMKTIARLHSAVPTETLIRWATLNGAEALGYQSMLGSIEVGKRPGLNLITLDKGGKITAESTSVKIV